MALCKLLVLTFLLANAAAAMVEAQAEDAGLSLMREAMDWPSSFPFAPQEEAEEFYGEGIGEDEVSKDARRSLFWHRMRYYISYAALSANRVPCPPRSGRSYYTHNCYRARGPVHPYSRNCEVITRCRR
ncbi:protein RALF-like 34 [Musa acuminata AAA Group]|uniref:protein RALF-like 34 n=1 Tax=Musa acuminata AAA Group TaxID=214697 RepID=UPI0031E3D738